MKFRWISGLVTAVIFGLGLNGAQAGEGHPDAIIKLRGDSFALGFGFSWGSGTLTYRGKDYPVEMQGFSLVDIGVSRIDAVGRVYNLKKLSDFNGNYAGHPGDFLALSNSNVYANAVDFSISAAVPEISTWAMMLVGFGMMGAASRVRRRGAKFRFA